MNRTHIRNALSHRIGEHDTCHIDQLPDPAVFLPHRLSPDQFDLCRLGTALAVAFFKLTRQSLHPNADIDIGACDLALYVSRMPEDMASGFLGFVEMLLQMALFYPERLPALLSRLDAADNGSLQEDATAALCSESTGANADGSSVYYGDNGAIFAGLIDCGPFADESGR